MFKDYLRDIIKAEQLGLDNIDIKALAEKAANLTDVPEIDINISVSIFILILSK